MATLEIDGDTVTVRFTRGETIAALRPGISFPRRSIVRVVPFDDGFKATRGLRAPGLDIPRYRRIGTWRRRGGKELVSVRAGRPAVRIELAGEPHTAVVIGVEDPRRTLAQLTASPPEARDAGANETRKS